MTRRECLPTVASFDPSSMSSALSLESRHFYKGSRRSLSGRISYGLVTRDLLLQSPRSPVAHLYLKKVKQALPRHPAYAVLVTQLRLETLRDFWRTKLYVFY